MEVSDFLKTKHIWLGSKIANMNCPEDYFELEDLLEEYYQTKSKDENLASKALPFKIERIIAVVAQKWGSDYPGSTVGILGNDAIKICEERGIDWKNYC
jgi:hypothetical protein